MEDYFSVEKPTLGVSFIPRF